MCCTEEHNVTPANNLSRQLSWKTYNQNVVNKNVGKSLFLLFQHIQPTYNCSAMLLQVDETQETVRPQHTEARQRFFAHFSCKNFEVLITKLSNFKFNKNTSVEAIQGDLQDYVEIMSRTFYFIIHATNFNSTGISVNCV